jgi:hypothetical protein
MIRSNLLYLSALFLGAIFLMLSCGSSVSPAHLIVHVPPHFSGPVHVMTCVNGAPAGQVQLDAQGMGKSSLCPEPDRFVELEIIREDGHYTLNKSEVRILRTGDGIATAIEGQVRK